MDKYYLPLKIVHGFDFPAGTDLKTVKEEIEKID